MTMFCLTFSKFFSLVFDDVKLFVNLIHLQNEILADNVKFHDTYQKDRTH